MDFNKEFLNLTGFMPFAWQTRLFREHFLNGVTPSAVDLPTGLGKTSIMAIWKLALDAGAVLPRRLIYVVDRRAVVDQATTVAEAISVASGGSNLRVSTLRGQLADNRQWLEDPAVPAIVVGTVDMIGSRLLFSGYGVSRTMRPFHAGLLGVDSLVVLDESHLVPPFERLLETIESISNVSAPSAGNEMSLVPRFRLLSLSATGRERSGEIFRLEQDKGDLDDKIVNQRLEATKDLTIKKLEKDEKLPQTLADQAWGMADEGKIPVKILVYCDKREDAEAVHKAILKKAGKTLPKDNIQLLTGARRVRERIDAEKQLRHLGFLPGNENAMKHAVFLVATSAGEVGIDIDATHMVCDLVPWERMVQRLGRVNRRGTASSRVVVLYESAPKKALPEQTQKVPKLLHLLPTSCDGQHREASPGALLRLKQRAKENQTLQKLFTQATTPPPLYPELNRPLADAWSMTSLEEHTGRPEIAPWLRGWVEDDAPRTVVVWRRFLPVRPEGPPVSEKEAEAFFAATAPQLSEMLETEVYRVRDWLNMQLKSAVGSTSTGFILNADGSLNRRLELGEIISMDKKEAVALLAGRTLIVDSRLGGLSQGLLESGTTEEAPAADNPETWQMEVSFLIEKVKGGEARQGAALQFPLCMSKEGEVMEYLAISSNTSTEEGRSLSSRPQLLEEHHSWTQTEIRRIAKALRLPQQYENALALAARKHDTGKTASCWQTAANAPDNGMYAKTAGPFVPSRLGGYRHEFGSLLAMLEDPELQKFPADLQDLILHLVATHHGRGRPVIPSQGCAEAPPSRLAAVVRDVALRHARLQKRWGPWGLAWWESLLRAADQRASRLNTERGTENGQS